MTTDPASEFGVIALGVETAHAYGCPRWDGGTPRGIRWWRSCLPVRPEHHGDRTGVSGEREIIDRRHVAVFDAEAIDFDDGHGATLVRCVEAERTVGLMRTMASGRASLSAMSKPTIACIQGFCLGGGLATALLADLRVADRSAVFGIPAARLGIAYGIDETQDLVAAVGPSRARLMLYTARRFDATEANAMGLVDVLADDAVGEALALAETIAGNAPPVGRGGPSSPSRRHRSRRTSATPRSFWRCGADASTAPTAARAARRSWPSATQCSRVRETCNGMARTHQDTGCPPFTPPRP